jgi:hypothetical protein
MQASLRERSTATVLGHSVAFFNSPTTQRCQRASGRNCAFRAHPIARSDLTRSAIPI